MAAYGPPRSSSCVVYVVATSYVWTSLDKLSRCEALLERFWGPLGPLVGSFSGPFGALVGPLGAPRGQVEIKDQKKTVLDPILGPSGGPRDPPKGSQDGVTFI